VVVRFDNHLLAIDPAVMKVGTNSSRLTFLKNLRQINAQPARHSAGTVHLALHNHVHVGNPVEGERDSGLKANTIPV
jgi:hypothetical protein